MNVARYKMLRYDPVRSFEPIVELATGSLALAVHGSVPVASAREFIEWAKARPDEMRTCPRASPSPPSPSSHEQ